MGHLTATTTSPATKKPCFSEADFRPLGNNAKNSQQIATENKENVPQPTMTEVKVVEGLTQAKLVKTTGRAGNPAKIVMIKGPFPPPVPHPLHLLLQPPRPILSLLNLQRLRSSSLQNLLQLCRLQ